MRKKRWLMFSLMLCMVLLGCGVSSQAEEPQSSVPAESSGYFIKVAVVKAVSPTERSLSA